MERNDGTIKGLGGVCVRTRLVRSSMDSSERITDTESSAYIDRSVQAFIQVVRTYGLPDLDVLAIVFPCF